MQIINNKLKINREKPLVHVYNTQLFFNMPAAKLIGMSNGDRYSFRLEDDGTIYIFKDHKDGISHIKSDYRRMNSADFVKAAGAKNKDKFKVLNAVKIDGIIHNPLMKI